MGYRSEVAYIIQFQTKQDLNEFIALTMALGGERVKALKECQIALVEARKWVQTQELDKDGKRLPTGDWVRTPENDVYHIRFHDSDVKWYDGDAWVEAHHDNMKFAEARFEGAEWYFLRLGEEPDDQEDQYSDDGLFLHEYIRAVWYLETDGWNKDYEPIGDNLAVLE